MELEGTLPHKLVGDDSRFFHVVDSAVMLGSSTKGRSSSRTLDKALKQSASLQLVGGLCPSVVFGPTRLNTADDPSRGVPVRGPCPHSLLSLLSSADLGFVSTFKGLTRVKANWLRLSCLVVGFTHLVFLERGLNPRGTKQDSSAVRARSSRKGAQFCSAPVTTAPGCYETLTVG